MRVRFSVWFGLVVVTLGLGEISAHARAEHESRHRYEQVWSASVRLLRVDYHCRIQEADPEVGFVLFDYPQGERQHPGSLEIIRVSDGDHGVRIRAVMQIPSMPSYVERMILDRLERKLREDYGEPAPPPSEKPKPKPGADDAESPEDI